MKNRADCILREHSGRGSDSPDSASLHGCGDRHGFVDVVGEHGRHQTVIRVVGSFYHLLDGFELHDHLDGPENLKTEEKI